MDPFDITVVIYQEDGAIVGYNDQGGVVSKLTENGLKRLKELVGDYHLTIVDNRKPQFTLPKPKIGQTYIEPVRAVVASAVDRMNLPRVIDGVKLKDGDRILLTGQEDPTWNGVHVVKMKPRGMCRGSHQPQYEAGGLVTLVTEGDLYDSTTWVHHGGGWWAPLGGTAVTP